MKILVTDDNVEMRLFIRQSVCDYKDSVVECGTGEKAIDVFSMFIPDVVLMDMSTEKYGGETVIAHFRKIHPEVKVVIISEYETPVFNLVALREGATMFFSKENLVGVKKYLQKIRTELKLV